MFGISPLSLFYPLCPSLVSDSRAAAPLKRSLRDRLVAAASSFSVCHGPSLPLARTSLSVDALAPLPVFDSGGTLAGVTTSVSFWARHPWLFLPSSTVPLFNSANLIRAHVWCVGLVGEYIFVFPALSGAAQHLLGGVHFQFLFPQCRRGPQHLLSWSPLCTFLSPTLELQLRTSSSQGAPQHSLCFRFGGLSGLLCWFF